MGEGSYDDMSANMSDDAIYYGAAVGGAWWLLLCCCGFFYITCLDCLMAFFTTRLLCASIAASS